MNKQSKNIQILNFEQFFCVDEFNFRWRTYIVQIHYLSEKCVDVSLELSVLYYKMSTYEKAFGKNYNTKSFEQLIRSNSTEKLCTIAKNYRNLEGKLTKMQ